MTCIGWLLEFFVNNRFSSQWIIKRAFYISNAPVLQCHCNFLCWTTFGGVVQWLALAVVIRSTRDRYPALPFFLFVFFASKRSMSYPRVTKLIFKLHLEIPKRKCDTKNRSDTLLLLASFFLFFFKQKMCGEVRVVNNNWLFFARANFGCC